MTDFVQINRKFVPWTDEEGDPDSISHLLTLRSSLTWIDLLSKHRVVILAEAGSGKSAELAEQYRQKRAAGEYCFSMTVRDLGRWGVRKTLGALEAQQLMDWHSTNRPAWFFIDSVDEAKSNDVRLEDALRALAEEIRGAESRSHITLSGRHTDWESFGSYNDRYTQVFSGRALMAVGSAAQKREYVRYMKNHVDTVPGVVVWDALEGMFPKIISVEDFLTMLQSLDLNDHHLGLDYQGAAVVERLDNAARLVELLSGLVGLLSSPVSPLDEPLFSLIEAAAVRLLSFYPQTEVPIQAIDAAVRLSEFSRQGLGTWSDDSDNNLLSLLRATPERRRVVLWRAVEAFTGTSAAGEESITDPWQLELAGFDPGLREEDARHRVDYCSCCTK